MGVFVCVCGVLCHLPQILLPRDESQDVLGERTLTFQDHLGCRQKFRPRTFKCRQPLLCSFWGFGVEAVFIFRHFRAKSSPTPWVPFPFSFTLTFPMCAQPITRAKFTFYPNCPLEQLKKNGVPLSSIPKYLGGTGACVCNAKADSPIF